MQTTMSRRRGHDEGDPRAPSGATVDFAANDVRLSWRGWLVAGAIVLAALAALPHVWARVERIADEPDYRLPYELSGDYWLYARLCRRAAAADRIAVVGDSVVWGHYVPSGATLSHYLNEQAGSERFANLGVDGIHPAAMAGLVEYYGDGLAGRRVLLHCNLLWTASPRHDLQTRKAVSFNHPDLVPQFTPAIPCYGEPVAHRLSVAIRRRLTFKAWASHLRLAQFGGADVPAWSLDHPYECPVRAISLTVPSGRKAASPRSAARPWFQKGIATYAPPWVELETSVQWASLKRTVEMLRRSNEVFVLVGPFNEHMLADDSAKVYRRRKDAVAAWLTAAGVPHYVAPRLPSELYADASHPLAAGYRLLAERLSEQESFARFLREAKEDHR